MVEGFVELGEGVRSRDPGLNGVEGVGVAVVVVGELRSRAFRGEAPGRGFDAGLLW